MLNKSLVFNQSIDIQAPADRVWKALVDPEMISSYLFGTHVVTDWTVGSDIVFQGEWQGTSYRDMGKILACDPEARLQYTYWSAFTGLENIPENYSTVTFDLTPADTKTTLTLTQEGFTNESARDHSQQNWTGVLQKIRELVETVS